MPFQLLAKVESSHMAVKLAVCEAGSREHTQSVPPGGSSAHRDFAAATRGPGVLPTHAGLALMSPRHSVRPRHLVRARRTAPCAAAVAQGLRTVSSFSTTRRKVGRSAGLTCDCIDDQALLGGNHPT
ncbi:unnamed protein product [Durusdinium trenchii]|uniref:Uncharacterized protein n=2 Tax=Durusdinium trenchii TaxID=1381693 RepID=A0ABP0SPT7_9DINO